MAYQINFRVDPPKIPSSHSVIEVQAVHAEVRKWPMKILARRLDLGELHEVETPHGHALASKYGEVEYFDASGGLWARDARADEQFQSEERNWKGLCETETKDGYIFELVDEQQKELLEHARALLGEAGLIREEMSFNGIALDQVAQFNEKGEEINRAAGDATVRFDYVFDEIPFIGAGAKTQVFVTSDDGGPRITGAVHVWREIVDTHKVGESSAEAALHRGISEDGELSRYIEKGHVIDIDHIKFGYLALPAFMKQRYIYPAYQIEGRVRSNRDERDYFNFGRYIQAVETKQYRRAGLFAEYLHQQAN